MLPKNDEIELGAIMLPGLKEVIEERLKIGRDNKQKDEEGGINNDNNNRNNNNNNDVIISFCNFGFVDFVLNLVHCFNHLKINNYLIFSLDIQSYLYSLFFYIFSFFQLFLQF